MIINLHLVHKVSFCFVLLYFHLSSEICQYIKFIIGIFLNEQEEIKQTDFNNRKIRLFLTQHATQQLVMLISCIDYCCRVWHTSGPMCGPRWCIWSPNTWSRPTLTSSPSCWSTEYQRLWLKQSCWSPSTPHLLCSTHVNWQRRLYRHPNPDSSHPLMVGWPSDVCQKRGNPLFFQKVIEDTTVLGAPVLLTTPLVYIPLHFLFTA